MKLALFGGSGFVGKRTMEFLKATSMEVTEISRRPISKRQVVADITDLDSLMAIQEAFDCVVICSGKLPLKEYTPSDAEAFIDVNVNGINNILIWANKIKIKRIIYCSTLSFIPDPKAIDEGDLLDVGTHYMYKITKAAGEHLVIGFCRSNHIQYCTLRIASVYGPQMSRDIIFDFSDKIRKTQKIVIKNENSLVDFVHVDDVAKVILACCLVSDDTSMIINVTSGKPVTLTALIELLSELLSRPIPLIEILSSERIPTKECSDEALARILPNRISLREGLRQLIDSWG